MFKYYVNEEKKVVVAIAENCTNLAIQKILRKYPVSRSALLADENYFNKAFMHDTYSAKAKCDPNDEFDVEFGKKLAKKRLEEKLEKYTKAAIERWKKQQIKLMNLIQ